MIWISQLVVGENKDVRDREKILATHNSLVPVDLGTS